jgi:hypothetical protein
MHHIRMFKRRSPQDRRATPPLAFKLALLGRTPFPIVFLNGAGMVAGHTPIACIRYRRLGKWAVALPLP